MVIFDNAVAVGLALFGLVMVYSASAIIAQQENGSQFYYLIKQGIWTGIGLVAMVITIVLPSGDEQKLNVANDAMITRDGEKASLGQVQQGDNVRASFDPTSHKISKVDVRSKSSKAPDKSKSNDSSKSDDSQKK